jgi:hypothetical protein
MSNLIKILAQYDCQSWDEFRAVCKAIAALLEAEGGQS